jgi:hypothetical protein
MYQQHDMLNARQIPVLRHSECSGAKRKAHPLRRAFEGDSAQTFSAQDATPSMTTKVVATILIHIKTV